LKGFFVTKVLRDNQKLFTWLIWGLVIVGALLWLGPIIGAQRSYRLVQSTITGVLVGGVYALIALGIVVINKASGVFNFAHGWMMLFGGLIFYSFFSAAGVSLLAAGALALVNRAGRTLSGSLGGGLLAALGLAASTTFWAQATTANIRSLTAVFAALAFYALIRWQTAVRAQQPPADRWLVILALALGFGLSHHVSLAFIGLVCLTFIPVVDPAILRAPRRWWRPILAGLLGLLPLLYFPLRANSGAPGATPNLATLPGLAAHVLGLGFSGDFFAYTAPGILGERLRVMSNVLTFQMSPWLLAGAGVGLALLLWRNRPLAWLLGGSFTLHLFITAT